MGKHSGKQDPNDTEGPYGSGPHPSPEESQRKADEFEKQWKGSGGK